MSGLPVVDAGLPAADWEVESEAVHQPKGGADALLRDPKSEFGLPTTVSSTGQCAQILDGPHVRIV